MDCYEHENTGFRNSVKSGIYNMAPREMPARNAAWVQFWLPTTCLTGNAKPADGADMKTLTWRSSQFIRGRDELVLGHDTVRFGTYVDLEFQRIYAQTAIILCSMLCGVRRELCEKISR